MIVLAGKVLTKFGYVLFPAPVYIVAAAEVILIIVCVVLSRIGGSGLQNTVTGFPNGRRSLYRKMSGGRGQAGRHTYDDNIIKDILQY